MRFAGMAGALLVATLTIFAPVLGYGFVYEDGRDAHLTLDPARTADQIEAQPFRTALHLSRALDMALFGIQPWGFHLGSLIWHLANVGLVFAVAWLVLPPWGAVAAAGVFAWHPIQVEAVAYVSARSDLLAAGGVLLAVLSASLGSVPGAVVGAALALVSKESAIVAWGLVPLWAAWTRAPFPVGRWLLIGAAGAGVGAWVMADRIWGWAVVADQILAGQQMAAIGRLLGLLVVPWGFSIDHDWQALAWLGPVALIVSLGVTAWALTEGWWGRHWLAFGWLWTIVALSPRLVVPLYEGLHERHMYVVVIGWCLCVGHWLSLPTRERTSQWV